MHSTLHTFTLTSNIPYKQRKIKHRQTEYGQTHIYTSTNSNHQCSMIVRNTVVRATIIVKWETPDFGHP